VVEETAIKLTELPSFTRSNVEATINAVDLEQAQAIVDRLADASSE